MGNQPSTTNHNKLSKPKTNTNSTGAALKNGSPISVSSRHADLSAEGRQQTKDVLLSPVDNEFGSAVWTHKDDAVVESTKGRGRSLSVMSRSNSKTNSRANSRTNSRSNSLSCFGGRQGSDSKMSLVSASTVDLQAAIELLQKLKKNASPEDLAALHEVLEAPEDHAIPIAEPALSRRTSTVNGSSSSLTRRLSLLQTPGVGTRNSPVEGRRRTWNSWRAPQLDPDEEAKWRTSPRVNSLRTPQAALIEGSRDDSLPRAQTPSDLDYGHLGSLKLGTLVVTNGAPSPAPSTLLKPQHIADDDYFSSTEANSSPLMMKSTRRRGHVKSKSAVLPATSPFHPSEGHHVPVPDINKARSSSQDQYPILEDQTPKCLQIIDRSANTVAQNADRFAQSYQAEIPMSPFLASDKRPNTHHEEGFGFDGIMDFKTEATRIFQDTIFAEPESRDDVKASMASSSAFSAFAMQKPKNTTNQRPPVRTTDSGYSSGGSVRTADRNSALSTRSHSSSSPRRPDATQPHLAVHSNLVKESCSTKANSNQAGPSSSAIAQPLQMGRRPPSLKILSSSARCTSSKTHKRFHRRRPSQSDPPVVQSCQPIPEGTIPEVPTTVRAKFERRLSHNPGTECLTHTYPSKDHVVLDEPTTDAPTSARTEFTQLAELEPSRPPTPPAHGRSRSLSFFRRKSIAGKKENKKEMENAALGVVDLGTIASSLGTSPYDAAISKKTVTAVTVPTHPHQLGGSLPRSKSMTSIAAAEFARMHSKDLALAERDMPQQRRKSFHNLKKEAGEATASRRRPQSSDIPPVPVINFSKLTPPPTAKARSQSASPEGSKTDLSFSARSQQRRTQRASQIVGKYDSPQQMPVQQSVGWEAQTKAWSQRRQNAVPEVKHSSVTSRTQSQAPVDITSWGRFSGGLEYNYEGRGVGIGGSAGTRTLHSHASSKSMHFKHQYGVDLSDVPIMLQRI
jgi:hypothetical protein